jgi:hypothetical protein
MISSNLHSLHARERQREMIAQADRHRLARQLRGVTRASRLVGPAQGPRRGILVAAVLARRLPRYRAAR